MRKNKPFKPQVGERSDSLTRPNQQFAGLLSRKQVAEILGTCVHTIARNRQLSPIKFNARLLRYHPEDVQRFIQAATTGTEEKIQ
jgi:hypothetical protein